MKDDKDFFNWYKTKITQNQQDPPEDAWKNISEELDINDVWDKVAVKLDGNGQWFTQKALYYAIPLLLLLLLSGGIYLHLDQKKENSLAGSGITISGNERISRSEPDIPEHASPDADVSTPRSTEEKVERKPSDSEADGLTRSGDHNKEKNPLLPDRENIDKNSTGSIEKNVPHETFIVESDLQNSTGSPDPVNEDNDAISLAHLIPGTLQGRAGALTDASDESRIAGAEKRSDEGISEDREQAGIAANNAEGATLTPLVLADSMLTARTFPVGLYPVDTLSARLDMRQPAGMYSPTIEFGITASAKNTWLLNTTTFSGLEKHTLNTTLPDFGKDIGLLVCFNFSPKLSAQAEGMFVSEIGQRYNEYRNGKYINREIDLQYYTLNLLLKYSRNRMLHGQPLNGHSIVGGIYTRALNKASQTIGGQSMEVSTYSKHDYGMILGYEYNRYMFSNLVISTGLRLNYGFPDIDTNSWSRTATGSFDLNIALRYRVGL